MRLSIANYVLANLDRSGVLDFKQQAHLVCLNGLLPRAQLTFLKMSFCAVLHTFLCCFFAGTLAVGGGNIRSKADVAHVAGSLIRSALPMHYHITVNGGRI